MEASMEAIEKSMEAFQLLPYFVKLDFYKIKIYL